VRPVICMITDRHRLNDGDAGLIDRVVAAARSGVAMVQVRERDLEGAALTALVARCVDAARGTRTRILVNDRVDVALAAGAGGVHLRGDSMPAARVRTMSPRGFLVGRSVHDVDDARASAAAGGLDYLIFGPVFETVSKPGRAAAGLDALRLVAAATPLPVLAVGGITADRVAAVMAAGAAGFAAIGLFTAPADALQLQVRQSSLAFDTPGTAT
jgi:thiamine-phosphate diphosphorylase